MDATTRLKKHGFIVFSSVITLIVVILLTASYFGKLESIKDILTRKNKYEQNIANRDVLINQYQTQYVRYTILEESAKTISDLKQQELIFDEMTAVNSDLIIILEEVIEIDKETSKLKLSAEDKAHTDKLFKIDSLELTLNQNQRDLLSNNKDLNKYYQVKVDADSCFTQVNFQEADNNKVITDIRNCMSKFNELKVHLQTLKNTRELTTPSTDSFHAKFEEYWNVTIDVHQKLINADPNGARTQQNTLTTIQAETKTLEEHSKSELESLLLTPLIAEIQLEQDRLIQMKIELTTENP